MHCCAGSIPITQTWLINQNSAPSQEALDRLDVAIEAAVIKRVADKVMPNGRWIGTPGGGEDVRELSGGTEAATRLFDYLTVGGSVYRSEPNLTIVKLPGKASFITYRPVTASGSPAVDINVPPIPLMKFHFTGGK